MASITSLGVGSGLDLNTIVTQLVALERQPLQQMQSDASALSSKVSLYGQISSLFSGLQDASDKLDSPTFWQQTAVESGDSSTVAVTATTGAAAGSYAVTVQALASNQTVAAGTALADANASVGSGTLTLQLGSWDSGQTSFTPQTGSSALSISVTSSDTLTTLRDKINSAGAGVTASLVTDASGVRLSLRSATSGADNGFRLSVADDDGSLTDGAGLSRFAYDPASGATGMTLAQPAGNALATVNGISVQSASNDITGAVDGLTLSLKKLSASPVDVTVSRDTASIDTGIKSFVTAYNSLASYLNTQTKYDATSKTGGPLQGDSAATSLQTQLRGILNTASGASSTYQHLSDIGLQSQRDGTLVIDQTKLDSAEANPDQLQKAFSNSDPSTAANDGFARRYYNLASQVLGIDGTITTRTAGLQKQISQNSDEQDQLNTRVDQYQTNLVAQYTQLDSNVAQLNSLSSYVTQALAQMSKSSS